MDYGYVISKYLEGEMDPDEALEFENSLKENVELRKEYELYQEVNMALEDTEMLNLRAQLEEIHEELTPHLVKPERSTTGRLVRYTLAATVTVILSLGTYSLFYKKVDDRQLVDKFYKPYDVTLVNRSANEDISPLMREALYLYETEDYEKAAQLFYQIFEINPKMTASHFYSGVSYMELGELDKAEKALKAVIDHNDNLYIEQAEYYLGMVYLLREEKEKAREIFTKIRKEEGYYSDQARKILRKLKKD